MSGWGKADNKTASGTVAITTGGAVTGTSTAFTTQAAVGDFLRVGAQEFIIKTITSNTVATVINANPQTTWTAVNAGASYTLSEKPTSLASDSNILSTNVFGVDATEISAGGDNVVSVAVVNGGTLYVEAPVVSFTGGGGSGAAATATISDGAVTAITITNTGSSYETVPAVVIPKARVTIPTSLINTTTDTFAFTGHGLTPGDSVVYNNGGGASATGLTSGTTYFIATAQTSLFETNTANLFKIKETNTSVILTSVVIDGTDGEFTCDAAALAVGDRVTITGTLGGTGTITGYVSGTVFKVSAITGTSPNVTGFTLTDEAGVAIVTTAGTPTGLTYTAETIVDVTGTGNNAQFFEKVASTAATAVAAKGTGESGTSAAHTGWVKRTVGTGQNAGRVQYEVLVALSKNGITGDAADDLQFPDA
jgi:hypothetical protein